MSGNLQTNENLPGAQREGDDGQTKADMSIEAIARRMGWYPKEEFRGGRNRDASKWLTAEEFVRVANEQVPVMRSTLRKQDEKLAEVIATNTRLESEIQAVNAQVAESRQATLDIKNMLTTAEERAYSRAVKDLSAKMDTAITEGDVAGAQEARKQLETVTTEARERAAVKPAEKKDADATIKPRVNPDADAWIKSSDQAWYREIPGAKGWAEQMFVDRSLSHLPIKERLDEIAKMAPDFFATKYPKYFPEPDDDAPEPEPARAEREPSRRAAVNHPRSPGVRQQGGEPTFDDIPAEDQAKYFAQAKDIAAHAKAKGTKETFTKEEFTKFYAEAGGFANRKG